MGDVPYFPTCYEWTFKEEPGRAALEWFKDARYGLFMHYGLYSLLGRAEWVMYREKIHVAKYAELKDRFTAEKFDADEIARMACEAGMKYVNITTRHHDSFCLWDTQQTDFNSVNSPAGRDIVRELADACRKHGLGLFLYYSYARDWRHPYFPPNGVLDKTARPHYDEPEPFYKWEKEEDTEKYIQFVNAQLKELLTNYGPIAGIWLDGIVTYRARPDLFHVEDTYALIRSLQPATLISFKEGATGEEDFYAPEHHAERARPDKMIEICTTVTGAWGYDKSQEQNIKSPEQIMSILQPAWERGCNVLLNTGLLGDGSIHPGEKDVLLEVGRRLRNSQSCFSPNG